MSTFADTSLAVHHMCCAGERGDDLGYYDSVGLLRFSRTCMDQLGFEVHAWRVDVPRDLLEPPTISRTFNCWHESFCHLTLPG